MHYGTAVMSCLCFTRQGLRLSSPSATWASTCVSGVRCPVRCAGTVSASVTAPCPPSAPSSRRSASPCGQLLLLIRFMLDLMHSEWTFSWIIVHFCSLFSHFVLEYFFFVVSDRPCSVDSGWFPFRYDSFGQIWTQQSYLCDYQKNHRGSLEEVVSAQLQINCGAVCLCRFDLTRLQDRLCRCAANSSDGQVPFAWWDADEVNHC